MSSFTIVVLCSRQSKFAPSLIYIFIKQEMNGREPNFTTMLKNTCLCKLFKVSKAYNRARTAK